MNEINLHIDSLGNGGEGIARHNNRVYFVKGALPGEEVLASILQEKPSYSLATTKTILTSSPERVQPLCPYFERCGGCDLQHMPYSMQLQLKTDIVKNNLKKFAKVEPNVAPCIPSPTPYNYRNKMAFPIVENRIGMFEAGSHKVLEINRCLLADWATKVISAFNQYLSSTGLTAYNPKTKKGTLRHLVCRYEQDQLLLCVVSTKNTLPNLSLLIDLLSGSFDKFGIILNINKQNSSQILSNQFVHLYGTKEINCNLFGISFPVPIDSFLQVNTPVANQIYNLVQKQIWGKSVVNAYSGAGLLTALLASSANHVTAIELAPSAHKSANQLIKDNLIKNVTNLCGDVAQLLPQINDFESIVLDPPRSGCGQKVLDAINQTKPKQIIYISCDSATLARDISRLSGYKITKVQPFDMFPQTRHVETLMVLERI